MRYLVPVAVVAVLGAAATLPGAGSELEYVDLRGADLRGADLTGVRADGTTVWPTGFAELAERTSGTVTPPD